MQVETGPYDELLENTPAELADALIEADDSNAGHRWLTAGTMPDPEAPGGTDPERRHLGAIGCEDDGTRWLEWHGERYTSEPEDIDECGQCGRPTGPNCTSIAFSQGLDWRMTSATFMTLAEQSEADGYEGVTPAGSYYAAVSWARVGGEVTYHGIYRTETRWTLRERASAEPATRIWLNARAERAVRRIVCR